VNSRYTGIAGLFLAFFLSAGACNTLQNFNLVINLGEQERHQAVAGTMLLVRVLHGLDPAPEDVRIRSRGTVSGAIVDPSGYVLTSFHALANMETGAILYDIYGYMMPEGRHDGVPAASPIYKLELVDSLPDYDLALLKISGYSHGWIFENLPENHRFPYLRIERGKKAYTTQTHYVIGYPAMAARTRDSLPPLSIFKGSVVAVDTVNSWIHSDIRLVSGLSGAPVLSTGGRLIGIGTSVHIDPRTQAHISRIRSINAAFPLLDSIPKL
jgi:S1-C subfamily serine protease